MFGRRHPVDRPDGTGQFALQRAGLVDLLLELGGGETVGAVEDLVADGAAGGQTLLGKPDPGLRDLIRRYQDLGSAAGNAVLDMLSGELFGHLSRVAQVQIAIQQCHRLAAAAQEEQREQPEHAEGHGRHGGQPRDAERLQPIQQGIHAVSAPGSEIWLRMGADLAANGGVWCICGRSLGGVACCRVAHSGKPGLAAG